MKAAVSIPDGLFARAERLAKRARRSPSELYAAALALDEYVARHALDEVTDTMNRVCFDVVEATDFLTAAARQTLHRVEW